MRALLCLAMEFGLFEGQWEAIEALIRGVRDQICILQRSLWLQCDNGMVGAGYTVGDSLM